MYRYISFRILLGMAFLWIVGFVAVSTVSGSPASSYSLALRRYPYLTDVVGPYATINWATDRSEISGGVRYGKVGTESCTAHYVVATKTSISVNGVAQYQWKAQLDLEPGTQYCYRVYLGTSPSGEIDLLGSDTSPSFWTQVPTGANQSFSFIVIGDWGQVNADGTNPYQADLMSLIASSGARFGVTTGDNGYPSANQKNFGDLVQTGDGTSAVFGPSFWKVPGASLPLFLSMGNHGFSSSDVNHPTLINWPQDRAAATSDGRYIKETYCCLNGSISKSYPSAWYAFDAGPARFYVLNAAWEESNVGTASEYQMDYDYHWAPGTPQYEWLQADLAAHPSVLKFAFFHYPIYSDNPHEAASPFLLGSDGLEGLLKQHSVDIAFTGHAHIYERNLASADGVINYITGGGGATPGTLGTCTALDAYAIKFTTSGKACGSAPVPTSAGQIYHFLKVTVNGTSVTVTPINSLGQSFDVQNYSFTAGAETTTPSTPTGLSATPVSGTQIDLSWSASSDNTGVRGYGIYRDGDLVGTVDMNTLNYSDADLLPATSYTYRVDAFDGSGNHSPRSSSRSATTQSLAVYTFPAAADAYVAGDVTGTNYGGSSLLKADASPVYRSYLRFQVGGLSGTVTKATLRLYTTSSSSTGYQVKGVNSQNWEEGQITDVNAPAPGSTIGSSGNIASNSWTSVDVTSLITGNGVYDLSLTTSSTATLNFKSRNTSSEQPQLVIETSAAPAATQTPTTSPGDVLTFAPNADARVVLASPTTNYGAATTLLVDGGSSAQTSYIRFDVNSISEPIQNVKLRVFCTTNGSPDGPAVYLADSNWTEGEITWNNQPALLSGVIDNAGAIGTSSWVEYDVTGLMIGNGTYTFALVADGNDGATFSAREGSSDPQLVVTLGGGGMPAASATATITRTPTAVATSTSTPTNVVAATPTSIVTTTATSGSTSALTYTTVADARVSQTSPTTNYGTASTFQTDGGSTAQTSYVRFNVSGISNPIINAKLRVFCTTNGTVNGPAVYLAASSWTESGSGGITWNNQPALLSGVVDNTGAFGIGVWVEYDVTGQVSGNGTYTFALVADSTDGVTFSSREGTSDPELVVTFGTGGTPVSPTATLTRTPTSTTPPTFTSTLTATPSFTSTSTQTGTATATWTPTPTVTDVPTFTATFTLTSTPTATDTSTVTPTSSSTATDIPTFTATSTFTSTPTPTFTSTYTSTATDVSTDTPTPTHTSTPTATDLPTHTPTFTPTATDVPTATFTSTPTHTSTATDVPTDTPTATQTSTATVTDTPVSDTPTFTSTPTLTDTPAENTATFTPTPVESETPTFTPTETTAFGFSGSSTTYIAEADTRVSEVFPATNYGTQNNLFIHGMDGSAQISYVRFTVSGITGTIQSVKLRVFCTTNGTMDGPAVYLAENNWIEKGTDGITWNTRPALIGNVLDDPGAIATDSWVEYDVTAWIMEDGTYTFALVVDGTDGVTFSSREGTISPELVVTFVP